MSFLTFTYKQVGSLPIELDVYPPTSSGNQDAAVPVLIWFHAGGLTVGDRKTMIPNWLKNRLNNSGIAFISADYRLLGPTTGHDVLEDVLDVFQFVAHQLNALLETFQIDPDLIAVAGASAGGLCAFLAATQATPRPLANLSICPMGANFLHDDYLKPKTEPFFLNYPLFAASTAPNYIYPKSQELPVIAGSPLTPPHEPQNPRQALYPLYLQRGDWLDYYTGDHGLSERLRADRKRETIPQEHLDLFPQFGSLSQWPPTFFILAGADTVVPSHAAYHLRELLAEAGVDVTLRVGEGEEHLFDVLPTAEDKYGKLFDEAAAFLVKELRVHK